MARAHSQGRLGPGRPDVLGVTAGDQGVDVAVFSAHAEAITLCIFDKAGDREIERIRLPERTGDIFHGHVRGISRGARYGFRVDGPYDPHAGHRFNAAKLLVDPHALALDRPFSLDPSLFGFAPSTGGPDPVDSAPSVPKAIVTNPVAVEAWEGAVGWDRMVVAELHVRGFTKLHPGVPEHQRGTFAGLASPAALAHFKTLGITTIELLPAAASLDERHLKPLGLSNYWNYNPVAFMAPDPRLAPGGWDEIRTAVATLNAAGIEVLLDVVYNHSGEGDAEGPTVSLRGFDNASYYRLNPTDPAGYVNDAGCGNILAADRTPVVRLVMDALRAWARFGGINGFRFDLATTLGRRASGFEANAPLLNAIEQDPVLRPLRMIAEPWDIGPGGYQVGAFDARWGEWNDRYRDDIRRYWRGDGAVADLATRLSGSTDRFWFKRRPSRSINFVTAHDGFTLADLVAYSRKHNEANGEQNRDGTNDNYSWSHGVEGPTDDAAILEARRRDQRNLLATLMLSRGTPMLGPGSATGDTQGGNNNAYAQDNPISWTDWGNADRDLPAFVGKLTAFRAGHPALRSDHFLSGRDLDGLGLTDVAWLKADGSPLEGADWQSAGTALVAVLAAASEDGDDPVDRVANIFHAGQGGMAVRLPDTRNNRVWRLALDTSETFAADVRIDGGAAVDVPGRTVLSFVEERATVDPRGTRGIEPDMLDRLAQAAGIAPDWTEINGTTHAVSVETKQALLAAMGLPARSNAEARDRLDELARIRDLRPVPTTLAARTGSGVALRICAEAVGGRQTLAVAIRRDDGSADRVSAKIADLDRRMETGADGRPVEILDFQLPPQPAGRHDLVLEDLPDDPCMLTVAPPTCYLPRLLAEGGSALGIAAHLYTLRSKTDGGIGDFATLAHFSERSAHGGASLVGLNPIHAMFAGNRDRASPYNPSDRRFLDPIYLDTTAPMILGGAPDAQAVADRQSTVVGALQGEQYVDYPKVWAAKAAVLEAAFAAFDQRCARRPDDKAVRDFLTFLARGGAALQHFATFEALSEVNPGRGWPQWEPALQTPDAPAVAAFAAQHAGRIRFHAYLQWLSDRQLADAARRGRDAGLSIGLYGDLAVGCAPDGAEAWSEHGAYARNVSVGSPPDPFSATGQVWSLPPPNPVARHRIGNALFSRLLEANMRHAGALRIDHAMGLSRLFWVPDGAPGAAGAYVSYDLEANLTDVALASHRSQCLVIGEDLGTVQEGFRDRLAANDILAYRVLFFEREGLRFKPSSTYPRKALACVATHDLPPLAGWWWGRDIEERLAVRQIDRPRAEQAAKDRVTERRLLAEAVGQPALTTPDETAPPLIRAVHTFIAQAPSMLVVTQADDLAGEEESVNLPGTSDERPNWRRRLPVDVDELFDQVERDALLPRPRLQQ